jgi:hypothetical protein
MSVRPNELAPQPAQESAVCVETAIGWLKSHADLQAGDNPKDNASSHHGLRGGSTRTPSHRTRCTRWQPIRPVRTVLQPRGVLTLTLPPRPSAPAANDPSRSGPM